MLTHTMSICTKRTDVVTMTRTSLRTRRLFARRDKRAEKTRLKCAQRYRILSFT